MQSKNVNINIKTFDNWAISRKDIKMEKGHKEPVNEIFNIISTKTSILNKKFSFLDLGCGNGWTVRKISQNDNCKKAVGIDGSANMIKLSKSYNVGDFYQKKIEDIIFNQKFDVIFSMETFYYLNNIRNIFHNINKNGINKNGIFIIGIDHYKENIPTLDWDTKYNLSINTQTINQWIKYFKNSGFINVNHLIYGANKDWNGTLIIYGIKN